MYNKIHAKISKRVVPNFVRKHKIACIIALAIGVGVLMLVIGIVLLISSEDSAGGASVILLILGICVPGFTLMIVSEEFEKKEGVVHMQKAIQRKGNISVQSIGKSASKFYLENCDDVVEQLRVLGFMNIVTKPEKKGLLDTEGAIKAISVAGNSDFRANDEFDINSKVIIRYYTKNVKK